MFLKNDIDSVEFEIMAYLVKHPMASDSLVGITQWWLQQQAIEKNKILLLVLNCLTLAVNELRE